MCGFQGRGAFIRQGAFVREGRLIQTCQLRGALIRWEAFIREGAFIRSFVRPYLFLMSGMKKLLLFNQLNLQLFLRLEQT